MHSHLRPTLEAEMSWAESSRQPRNPSELSDDPEIKSQFTEHGLRARKLRSSWEIHSILSMVQEPLLQFV